MTYLLGTEQVLESILDDNTDLVWKPIGFISGHIRQCVQECKDTITKGSLPPDGVDLGGCRNQGLSILDIKIKMGKLNRRGH